MTEHLSVCFVWHMHQPLYKDRLANKYIMPWVRLHGVKDYLDMPTLLTEYPKIRQTFNLVPSLIEQIEDYANYDASDQELYLALKKPADYNDEDKLYILNNSFHAELKTQITPYEHYYALYIKKTTLAKQGLKPSQMLEKFTLQEFSDMITWFNLTWFDSLWLENIDELKKLIIKGHNFTDSDRKFIIKQQRDLLKQIIPTYKKLQNAGQLEVITSPYYHPILPLLIDSNLGKLANSYSSLPKKCYLFPQDASAQLAMSVDLCEKSFGLKPQGMWPSELSISMQALSLIAKAGIEWVVADEALLTKALELNISRDEHGNLMNPELLCQPYNLKIGEEQINIFFREVVTSNEIGFSFGGREAQEAASSLYMRLKHIQQKLFNWHREGCVVIALDGENCWQTYERDGQTFLRELYRRLSEDSTLNVCTVSDYLKRNPATEHIYNIQPGSWISADFHIWIGEALKNKAWELLWDTRQFLQVEEESNKHSPERIAQAFNEIYAAEGSDWFWWYGEPNNSEHDAIFDSLFRQNLKNVYIILDKAYPKELDIPVGELVYPGQGVV